MSDLWCKENYPKADKLFIFQEFAIWSDTNSQVPEAPPKDIKHSNMQNSF